MTVFAILVVISLFCAGIFLFRAKNSNFYSFSIDFDEKDIDFGNFWTSYLSQDQILQEWNAYFTRLYNYISPCDEWD